MDVKPSREMRKLGEATARALLFWDVWSHRKVESLSLLVDERARRRVSVDCTPQPIYWPGTRQQADVFRRSDRQIVVPLTLMAKEIMRDLDVTDGSGNPLPVLGRSENSRLAAAAMYVLTIENCPRDRRGSLWSELIEIASGSFSEVREKASRLVAELDLNDLASNMVLDLAENFLLAALLPARNVHVRQVVKFSYHWEMGHTEGGMKTFSSTTLAGLGFGSVVLRANVTCADKAESYHFEVPAPEGLLVRRVGLVSRPSNERTLPSVVGHAQANYAAGGGGEDTAEIRLRLQGRGLLTTALLYSALSTVFFLVLAISPAALTHISDTETLDAATALLVLAPALLFGLAARGTENALVSRVLVPLRVTTAILSLLFLILAVVLILAQDGAMTKVYVSVAFWISSALLALTLAGRVSTFVAVRVP